MSEATYEIACQKLGHVVRLWGEDRMLSEITPALVDGYVLQRRKESVVDLTISREVNHMISVLRMAKRHRCYAGDLEALKPLDLKATYEPRKRYLTRSELFALLSELPAYRAAAISVCVALGCRLGEAMRLLPTDIEQDRVHIRGTKTAGSRRTVPILSLYRPMLEFAIPYLPLQPWGKDHHDIIKACKRAGIERCSWNDFRRTHATLLVEAGVDRDVVRRLLGHSTALLVDRVYGQPSPEALGALAETKLATAARLLPAGSGDSAVREAVAGCGENNSNALLSPELADPAVLAFRRKAWEWFHREAA